MTDSVDAWLQCESEKTINVENVEKETTENILPIVRNGQPIARVFFLKSHNLILNLNLNLSE